MFDKPEFIFKHMVILSGFCIVYLSNVEIKGHFTPHLLIFYIKLNPNQIIGLDKKKNQGEQTLFAAKYLEYHIFKVSHLHLIYGELKHELMPSLLRNPGFRYLS